VAAPDRQILIVAGEVSGDHRGARLMAELAARGRYHFFGLGGDAMRAEGLTAVAHASEIAVVGLFEALRVLPRARRIFGRLLRECRRRLPAAAILIDAPDFNLRLAARLKRLGIPVVYYVSPQVWAWRQGRVRTIAKVVDRMLVLFPFEVDFYRKHGVEVEHVGHPLVDEIMPRPQAWDVAPPPPYRIAILPGSRESEIRALLPSMLDGVALLARRLDVHARLILAPSVSLDLIRPALEAFRLGGDAAPIELVTSDREAAIADSHLALCASGTATLEVGLLGTPLLVLYRMSRLTYRLALRLVKIPRVGLVNLVLGEGVAPELMQDAAAPGPIAQTAFDLLVDPQRVGELRARLGDLRQALGAPGASGRAADAVIRLLSDLERGAA
jgi:lipid-A-disaccharide synthase